MNEEIKNLKTSTIKMIVNFHELSKIVRCRKNTKSKNPRAAKTKRGKPMPLSKCAVCGSKKSRFIKEQEANRLLRSLGIKTPLSQIILVGPVLF